MSDSDSPNAFFTADHRACDAIWAEVEAAVDSDDGAAARSAWERFDRSMRHHLMMEEEVLFPALENATGMHGGGPTFMMRAEHQQIRGLLDQIQTEVNGGNFDGVTDHGDTLLMLIQQHNAKEEGILYPMCDNALGGDWPALLAKMPKR